MYVYPCLPRVHQPSAPFRNPSSHSPVQCSPRTRALAHSGRPPLVGTSQDHSLFPLLFPSFPPNHLLNPSPLPSQPRRPPPKTTSLERPRTSHSSCNVIPSPKPSCVTVVDDSAPERPPPQGIRFLSIRPEPSYCYCLSCRDILPAAFKPYCF